MAVDSFDAEFANIWVFRIQLESDLARNLDAAPCRAMFPRESGYVQLPSSLGSAYINHSRFVIHV
jgi:hypothetical protein